MSDLPQLGDVESPQAQQQWRPDTNTAQDVSTALREESEDGDAAEARLAHHLSQHMEMRLQRAIEGVTNHLEGLIKRSVHESHDAIAARIEDMTASQVSLALASAEEHGVDASVSLASGSPRRRDFLTPAGSQTQPNPQVTALQQRVEELETLVMRIASTTAKDVAAAREKTSLEIRAVDTATSGIRSEQAAQVEKLKVELRAEFDHSFSNLRSLIQSSASENAARSQAPPSPQTTASSSSPGTKSPGTKRGAWAQRRSLQSADVPKMEETSPTEKAGGETPEPAPAPSASSSGYPQVRGRPSRDEGSPATSASSSASSAKPASAEKGESRDARDSAVARVFEWMASSSSSAAQAGNDGSAATRGRAKAKPAEPPARELIPADVLKAAAQELVSLKNSNEGMGIQEGSPAMSDAPTSF